MNESRTLRRLLYGENNVCELSRFFTWALMVKVDSQVCVRVNLQGVRVNSQGVRVTSQPVRVISKHCTSCRLCGVPPHPKLSLIPQFSISVDNPVVLFDILDFSPSMLNILPSILYVNQYYVNATYLAIGLD